MIIGLDFGTTHSAVAFPTGRTPPRLAALDGGGTFRSVLYFDPELQDARRRPLAFGGLKAIEQFGRGEGGRLLQSLKSHLSSRTFAATSVFHARYTLEELIAELARLCLEEAGVTPGARAVVGRPVHFVADEDDAEGDVRAEARLGVALQRAGLAEVRFELEPVAAAWGYERRLKSEELVLIADFGGGTTDLCLVEVGPRHRRRGRERVVGTEGVGLAGDAFDQRILFEVVAPRLGKGSHWAVIGGEADVPLWLFQHLTRWHLLSFLKSQKTMHLLAQISSTADDPDAIERLRLLIDEDLGWPLHREVERAKIALSSGERARLTFEPAELDVEIERDDFERWIAADVALMGAAVDRLLATTGVLASDVNRVFLTGGTSLVPAVRLEFARRFGAEKLVGGEELTTVASGLALLAQEVFS
jgi:hypothetical chaperone protein